MSIEESLPVTECLDSLLHALSEAKPVVLKAPPGAGKTTVIPPAILDSGLVKEKQILVVQPRRLAAIATATRIAELRETTLGEEVGYQVRFERKASKKTKLLTLTTGLLLRQLISDPLLESVGCVVLDEFHERSIEIDLALGMIEQIRREFRPELQLVVMSATLDPGPLANFLNDSITLRSEGRSYPIEITYEAEMQRKPIGEQIASSLKKMLQQTDGDVLVFLPGVGEILRVKKHLQQMQKEDPQFEEIELLELYGSLPTGKQALALKPGRLRRVILSTNVAETSVTIPGVESVIDSGTARVLKHDNTVGLPKLETEPISKASADQRAGRAGRIGPGKCHRLWPPALQQSRRETDSPEIVRGDLSSVVLTLAQWGERDCHAFDWLTPPPTHGVDQATKLLKQLGAIDDEKNITSMGTQMVQLPVSPRLARLLLDAKKRGVLREAAIAASLLSERDPFNTNSPMDSTARNRSSNQNGKIDEQNNNGPIECDLWPRIEAIEQFASGSLRNIANANAAKQVIRVAQQLEREMERIPLQNQINEASSKKPDDPTEEDEIHQYENLPPSVRLRQALLTAFPDRLAKRRSQGKNQHLSRVRSVSSNHQSSEQGLRGVLAAGKGVRLRQSCVRDSELFLCLNMESSGIEASVRIASGLVEDWIDSSQFTETQTYTFDNRKLAVVARRQRSAHGLVIHEVPVSCKPSPEVSQLLNSAVQDNLDWVLPKDQSTLNYFASRASLIRKYVPTLELEEINRESYLEILSSLCQSSTSVEELRKADWHQLLKSRYDYAALAEIDRLAPSTIKLPSGRMATIEYDGLKTPKIAVRIQEIFGWTATPRILDARTPIQLHLLGPNGRPQQITEDLENFWSKTYRDIKKELKRRYPKHAWPEDPSTARATRNGLKPKP